MNIPPDGQAPKELVQVQDLVVHYPVRSGVFRRTSAWIKAVDGVSFTVREGETLGLVGESGCGKSTVGRAMLRLKEASGGSVMFNGVDILKLPANQLKPIRRDMQIVFQDPYSSLNPRKPVADAILAGLNIHEVGAAEERYPMVIDALQRVGLEEYYASRYPYEFSGGQRQRIGIARALVLRPRFIICDEPVSALDVSIQSQVLNLLRELQQELSLTYLFIAHNLSVVEHISQRVAVMYLGKIVELTGNQALFEEPLHPYTRALISAIPRPRPGDRRERILLPGEVPSPLNPPSGCHFHPRCPWAAPHCSQADPPLREVRPGHWAACWKVENRLI